MKYGQTFYAQSVPQWAPYNVDYDELKNLIKVNTTKDQAQAIAIPGQADPSLEKFETAFFNDFSSEHDRVELFVKSKADEISRRLHMHSLCELDGCCYPVPEYLQKVVLRLLARTTRSSDRDISQNQRDRIANYHVQIERCGDDIRSLERFVSAQMVAFHKIIKKYKRWTGSSALGERSNDEVLNNPKSLVRRDFTVLLSQYQDLSINLHKKNKKFAKGMYQSRPKLVRKIISKILLKYSRIRLTLKSIIPSLLIMLPGPPFPLRDIQTLESGTSIPSSGPRSDPSFSIRTNSSARIRPMAPKPIPK